MTTSRRQGIKKAEGPIGCVYSCSFRVFGSYAYGPLPPSGCLFRMHMASPPLQGVRFGCKWPSRSRAVCCLTPGQASSLPTHGHCHSIRLAASSGRDARCCRSPHRRRRPRAWTRPPPLAPSPPLIVAPAAAAAAAAAPAPAPALTPSLLPHRDHCIR